MMRLTGFTHFARFAAVAAVIVLGSGGLRTSAQAPKAAPAAAAQAGAKYTALAVNMDAPTGQVATPVDIVVERWSTDAERDRVMNALLEGGQDKLLAVVQSLPRIGSLYTAGSTGVALRYARHGVEQNGSDRVLIVTDRPISFGEARERPRTMDYPFAIVDMRISSNSRGEGRLLYGAKMGIDKQTNQIVLENFGAQPIALNDVRRQAPK
jgi:hypothetical protein